jgi:hypothetical protein
MRAAHHYTVDRRLHGARWPFAAHAVDAPPPIAPDFQFSLDRILRTTRFYLELEERTSRVVAKRRHSGR